MALVIWMTNGTSGLNFNQPMPTRCTATRDLIIPLEEFKIKESLQSDFEIHTTEEGDHCQQYLTVTFIRTSTYCKQGDGSDDHKVIEYFNSFLHNMNSSNYTATDNHILLVPVVGAAEEEEGCDNPFVPA